MIARAHESLGQLYLARKESSSARLFLVNAIALAREAVWPRLLLSRPVLQEGRDWAAAELALRAVLAIDPNQQEACNNLEILLRQQERDRGILNRLDETANPGAHP
jgi:hypothetical protein